MSRKREQGYVLVAALSVVAILLVLLAALQYQGLAKRRTAVRMEAQYLAATAVTGLESSLENNLEDDHPTGAQEFTLLNDSVTNLSCGNDPGGPDYNSVYLDTDTYLRGLGFAGNLFAEPDRMAVGTSTAAHHQEELQDRERLTVPLGLRVEGRPTSWNPTFDLFRRNRYQAVYSGGFPYAAYAPAAHQNIELEEVSTWALPAREELEEKVNPLQLRSGLKPYVGAGGDVTIQKFEYGEVYSEGGEIEAPGGAVHFSRYLPFKTWGNKPYTEQLKTSLERASSTLSNLSTDKTGVIFGKLSESETLALINSGRIPRNFFTYQSAASWWFLMLPSIKYWGVAIDLQLHVPVSADMAALSSGLRAEPDLNAIKKWNEEIDKLEQELLPSDSPPKEKWDQNTPGLVPKLEVKARQYRELHQQIQQEKDNYSRLQLEGKSQSELDKKQKQIDRLEKKAQNLEREVRDLDKKVQRKKDEIESKKERVRYTTDKLTRELDSWLQGNPTGPDALTEFVMSHLKLGDPISTSSAKSTKPAKAGSQKKPGTSDLALISKNGMLLHSYATVLVRLGAQLRTVVENAMNSFPTRDITIDFIFWKETVKVPDHSKLQQWLDQIGKDLVNGLLNMAVYEVPLVYLDGVPLGPIEDGHFDIKDTFQVPPGRTFKLRGDMTVRGDLWLQRGSSMTVEGNLTMVDPKALDSVAGYGDMMLPHGRIYMEEGTSLIVEGDLKGAGDRYLGSVVVCGPVKSQNGITSAIICKGSVSLPQGTAGGIEMQELAGWCQGDKGREVIVNLLHRWAPNLSKAGPRILGPFGKRMPFFGRYPVILRFFPPSAAPIPTFEPLGQNINCRIFWVLSYAFATHLNASLGENFTTATLWWCFGGEQVAIYPKGVEEAAREELDPAMAALVANYEWVSHSPEHVVSSIIESGVKLVESPELLLQNSIIPLALQVLNPDPTGLSQHVIDKALEQFIGENSLDSVSEKLAEDLPLTIKIPGGQDYHVLDSPLAKALPVLQDAVNGLAPVSGIGSSPEVEKEAAQRLLVGCPGVMVYAGGTLDVGPSNWYDTPAVRAVGCFIAQGGVNLNVRYTVGSVVSFEGSIRGRKLLYTPQYTRASLYKPKQLELGGTRLNDLDQFYINAINHRYGAELDTGQAIDIPSQQPFFQSASGWGP